MAESDPNALQYGSLDDAITKQREYIRVCEHDLDALAKIRKAAETNKSPEVWGLMLDASDRLLRETRTLLEWHKRALRHQGGVVDATKRLNRTLREKVCNDCGRKLGFYEVPLGRK